MLMPRSPGPGCVVPPALALGLADLLLCHAAALFVLFSAPGRRENRLLASLLFFEGTVALGAAVGLLGRVPMPDIAGFAGVFAVSVAALPPLYLLLLRDLPTPLARPLRPRAVVALVIAGGALLVWANLMWPPFPFEHDLTRATYRVLLAVNVLALVLAADAWRRAPRGTPQRRRARLFALAFGARDLVFVVFMLSSILSSRGMGARVLDVPLTFYGTLLFVPLLTYAIVRAQVLGIELTLKRGIRRGLVVAAFVLAFVVAAEVGERAFAARFGPAAGLGAAVLLGFALRPLDRAAERLAEALMPGVAPTAQYVDARKLELYRAALESAVESGGISEKERDSLARLREKLGVPAHAAAKLENEVVAGIAQ